MKTPILLLCLVLLLIPTAVACPPGQKPVFSCATTLGKSVEVCTVGADATYAFGRRGSKPDLFLRRRQLELAHESTGGTGESDASLTFRNGSVAYRIEYTDRFERLVAGDKLTEQGGESGQIIVEMKGRNVFIECKTGTIKTDFRAMRVEPHRDF